LELADWNPSVYDVIAPADLAGGRYKTTPSIEAAILWMKNRRYLEFSLAATSPVQLVNVGKTASYPISVSPLGGFSGTVTLGVSGLPPGATANFTPASVANALGTSTLTVTTSNTTPAGSYALTLTGTNGTVVRTSSVTLNIADFSVSVTPSSRSLTANSGTNSVSYTVTIGATNGFTGIVGLSVAGLPTGGSAIFSAGSITNSGSSTLTLS